MEVFCLPQFAPSSTEHGRRLENAVRTGLALILTQQAERQPSASKFSLKWGSIINSVSVPLTK
jgi:hypothetical protein